MQKPLTPKDKKILRKKLIFVAFFAAIAIAIFYMIYSSVLKDFSKSDGFGYIPLIIFGVFGLFFAGVIVFIAWSNIQDIKIGVKNCFEGVVEDKRLNISQSTSHGRSTAGGRRTGGSRTSTKRDYYITVAGTEHNVEYPMYSKVSVGDEIYFEIAPKSNALLHYEILEEAVDEQKHVQRYSRKTYPDSKIRKAPLTARDKDFVKRFYNKKLRSRLIGIAFFAFPVVGLLVSNLGGLLVFLFPLPLILIYRLYKLIRFYMNYQKFVSEGRKKLITTQITDKLFTTMSRNGAKSQKRAIKTTYGSLSVSEDIYQKLHTGDEIILHEAPYLSHVIGFSLDEVYYPLT
ncbi:hypothetical protein U8527_21095 [Kordia algicida OT-1]|uniref:Uncharacterized protein n=1 Tax=Kordia algicida OT-1 TaxID=391587 RepID=A9DL87_9FLAO|nr:hypothetical protein [Kordia algicida]EDP98506.1 hypothetical protein KAOT1_14852 [Kordia algicida OT-1]